MKKLEYYRKEKFEHYGNKYKNKLTYTDKEKETKMLLLEYISQNRWHPVKVGSMKNVDFHFNGDFTITVLFNDEFCIPEYEQDADGWSRVI
jgi:hypothetical protein